MSQKKLTEIQGLALAQNEALEPEIRSNGGCLLLGRHYAESGKIFFGLNPGLLKGVDAYTFKVEPTTSEPYNSPFRNWPEDNQAIPYFRNCEHKFLGPSPEVSRWFNDRMTSSFLVPWRSKDVPELYRLDEDSGRELFARSGNIIRKMIEHHEANVLVVAGKKAPNLLIDILRAGGPSGDKGELCEEGYYDTDLYQYSEWQFHIEGRQLKVLQVPHFSRASSSERLLPCARWLIHKMGLQR